MLCKTQILFFLIVMNIFSTNIYSQEQSVLSEGIIYKVPIKSTGIYVIDVEYLKSMDVNPDNYNPNSLQVFGNRGGILPEANAFDRDQDVMEIPVISTDTDNKWDGNDKIIFYAEAASIVAFNERNFRYEKHTNPYETNNYIFIKINGSTSKKLETLTLSAPITILDQYYTLQRFEEEKTNILAGKNNYQGTGREWYGSYFNTSKSIDLTDQFNFDEGITGKSYLRAHFISRANALTQFELSAGGKTFTRLIGRTSLNSTESAYARKASVEETIDYAPNAKVELRYNPLGASFHEGWLDYVEIISPFKFSTRSTQKILLPSLEEQTSKMAFKVDQPFQYMIDVSDYKNQKLLPYIDGRYTFEGTSHNRLIAVNEDYKRLEKGRKIENQNIHGLEGSDLVIIYHPSFSDAAQKLAAHRRAFNNYTVATVDIDEVYNEYASGRVDPTAIRDFARALKQKDDQFNYLLLMGDGTYDYRHIDKNNPDHNFIPVYETVESLNAINGFPSDDYYTFFDDDEGYNNDSKSLDIATGRLPVSTSEQALDVVNKIIHYDTDKKTYGNWRNRAVFVADDEDINIHIRDCDFVSRKVDKEDKSINVSKIYLDAYQQQSTPGGDRYYEASEALNRAANNGSLTITYLGHGGARGWAQERLLKKSDIDQWNNIDNLPVLVTATCSFAGYDEPTIVSAGEYALLKPDGGALGLLTTTRGVYSHSNKELTEDVYDFLFKKDENGIIPLGEALRRAKNQRGSSQNSRKFTLLGDPSQTIALPELEIVTTSIQSSDQKIDTVSALQPINISGEIRFKGAKMSDFNGEVTITFYDKKSTFNTLSNDKASPKFVFQQFKNILYKGKAAVKNGAFEATFVVPKDINYAYGKGKISYYAFDTENRNDASGYQEIIVGGSGKGTSDNRGPEINVYLNNRTFKSGDIVPSNSLLIVDLEDDLGINVTGSSIGHDLVAILDDDTTQPIILNEYYTAETGNYKKGSVTYPLNNLQPGKHTLTIKGWDAANNSNTHTIEFEVKATTEDPIIEVFPNPVKDVVTITFKNQDLISFTKTIEIYDTLGKLIYTKVTNTAITSINLERNNFLPGTYFCKIKVSSSQLNKELESKFSQIIKI